MEFCNVNEWMLEHNKGKEHCKWFDNATIIVIVVRHCTGLELLIDCWSHVHMWMCLVINVVVT